MSSFRGRTLPLISSVFDTYTPQRSALSMEPFTGTLIGSFKVAQGRRVVYNNYIRNWQRYYPIPEANFAYSPFNEPCCWDVTIPNADTVDFGFTSVPNGFAWQVWFHCFVAPSTNEYPGAISRSSYASESDNKGWSVGVSSSNDPEPKRIVGYINNNGNFTTYRAQSNQTAATGTTYCYGMSCTTSITRNITINDALSGTPGGNINCAAVASTVGLTFGNKVATGHIGFIEARLFSVDIGTTKLINEFKNPSEIFALRQPQISTVTARSRSQIIVVN